MDRILIRDLHLECIIGTQERERVHKQDVIINIAITTDLGKPAQTDRLEDAVNYQSLTGRIIEMVENSSCQLIETLAEKIAEICLENPAVAMVGVTVDKPGAIVSAGSVAVEIIRTKRA